VQSSAHMLLGISDRNTGFLISKKVTGVQNKPEF